jgi:hypothetical protein
MAMKFSISPWWEKRKTRNGKKRNPEHAKNKEDSIQSLVLVCKVANQYLQIPEVKIVEEVSFFLR